MKQILATGKILSTHGVRGFVKVRPYSDDTSHFHKLKNVSVQLKNGQLRELEVEEVKNFTNDVLIKFKGFDTPEDIRIFSGCDLLVPRENAARLGKGKIYTADLEGMKLIYDKEEAGTVVSVVEGAQSLLLEVLCNDGKKHMVPYMKGIFVDDPDVENGTIKLLRKDLIL